MSAATITNVSETLETSNISFSPWNWAAGVTLICVLPILLMGLGVDFSTEIKPLLIADTGAMTQSSLGEAVHAAARGNYTHTLLEWSATASAVFLFALAMMQFRLTRESSLMIIGIALLCAGAMDAFHTLAADRLISAQADNKDLIPFTWAICRMFNAVIQLVGVTIVVLSFRRGGGQISPAGMVAISGVFVLTAYLIIDYCANTATLPQTMFPDNIIKRPFDIYPIIPYAINALVVFPMYLRLHRNVFSYMLLIALIPDIATELYMAFGSTSLHDSAFNVAHATKAFSYMIPVIGLFIDYVQTYARQAQLSEERQVLISPLENAVEEAERASRVKSDFLANMSYELRTPMNSIMGFTKRLIKRLPEQIGERDMDALLTVDRNAEHLLILINDILDLSKIEAGRVELKYTVFDLSEVVQHATKELTPTAEAKGLRVELDLSEDTALNVQADSVKCRQMVNNLISNAIKYTDQGHITVSLRKVVDPELGDAAQIRVVDSGVGIREEDRDRLFLRFMQVDQNSDRRVGGTGLGLVIVKHYAELHGGRLEFTSEYGVGSDFWITIPLVASLGRQVVNQHEGDDRSSNQSLSPDASTQKSDEPATGLTVLCVDDEPDILKYLSLTFLDAGYAVRTALNLEQAISLAQTTSPDVICLDLELPGQDGYEILRKLKRIPAIANIPVVIVSATAEAARKLDVEACAFLSKPVDAEVLVETVQQVLVDEIHSALIVDDDPNSCQLIATTLIDCQIDATVANNGGEALESLVDFQPDVIFLDLMMPKMDGFEFLRNVKSDPTWSKIPIIVMSGKELHRKDYDRLGGKVEVILSKGQSEAAQLVRSILAAKARKSRKS